jgi:hypothetical protein
VDGSPVAECCVNTDENRHDLRGELNGTTPSVIMLARKLANVHQSLRKQAASKRARQVAGPPRHFIYTLLIALLGSSKANQQG